MKMSWGQLTIQRGHFHRRHRFITHLFRTWLFNTSLLSLCRIYRAWLSLCTGGVAAVALTHWLRVFFDALLQLLLQLLIALYVTYVCYDLVGHQYQTNNGPIDDRSFVETAVQTERSFLSEFDEASLFWIQNSPQPSFSNLHCKIINFVKLMIGVTSTNVIPLNIFPI